jgi:hypothetical protein
MTTMESTPRYKRRRVLIQPRLQLRIVLAFLSAACISTLVQVLLLSHSLSSLAESLPTEGNVVLEELPGILRSQVLLSFLLMAPLMLAVGVLETFRVVGPLYRIERYLRDVAAGTKPPPCKIRKGDELQELCNVVNQATQPFITGQHHAAVAHQGAAAHTEPPSLVREAAPSESAPRPKGA